MWTSDELTPRSRTFIPDRGARTFNLARLSHMKRTTDTRCGSRPLTQVYTLTLSHSLSLSHKHTIVLIQPSVTLISSLSLSYTLSCPIQLSLSLSSTHTTTRLVTLRLFTQTYCSLTHSLTQRRFTLRYTQNANARWSDLGRTSTHPPLPSSALSISLSLTHKHPSDTFCLFHFHCESSIREIFFEST